MSAPLRWLVVLALAVGGARGQSWQVEARAEPNAIALGETVQICVSVTAQVDGFPEPPRIREPAWAPGLVPIGLQHASQTFGGGQYRYDVAWTLQPDRLGTQLIPPIEVTWKPPGASAATSKRTEPVTVTVTASGRQEPEPGQTRLPSAVTRREGRHRGLLIGGLALATFLCAGTAFWLLRGHTAAEAPPATAEQSCLAELRRASALLREGDLQGYYAAAGAALRAYAGGEQDAALTSSELLARLAERGAGRSLQDAAAGLLAAGDAVRFARGSVPAERSWELLRRLEQALGEAAGGKGS